MRRWGCCGRAKQQNGDMLLRVPGYAEGLDQRRLEFRGKVNGHRN
jgi:hypothetical protein